MYANSSGRLIIYFSLFLSMCLNISPWSNQIGLIMPNWTLLVLMYWSMALPHKIGIGIGWLTGLLFDVLTGSIIGKNALLFSIAIHSSKKLYPRIRHYEVWQQTVLILSFFLIIQMFAQWINQLSYPAHTGHYYWLQAVSSTLACPIVFALLRLTRQRYKIR